MRSIEQVVIATVVYSASLICNVLVNALLIFGLFGLPKMGIMGAAIGTLTARIVELIIVIWYAKVKNHDVRFHPVYMRKIDKVLTNTVIPKGQRFFIFLDEDEVFSVPTSRIEARDYRIIGVIFRCLIDDSHRLVFFRFGKGQRFAL